QRRGGPAADPPAATAAARRPAGAPAVSAGAGDAAPAGHRAPRRATRGHHESDPGLSDQGGRPAVAHAGPVATARHAAREAERRSGGGTGAGGRGAGSGTGGEARPHDAADSDQEHALGRAAGAAQRSPGDGTLRLGFTSDATRSIAARLRSTSSSVVAHEETLMRMAVRPCHTVPPAQHVPSACTPAITRRVSSASPNDTST